MNQNTQRVRAAIACALAFAASSIALARVEFAPLLRNVSAIQSGGNPAAMVVSGEAQALVASPEGKVFAAAAEIEKGRVVAVGHGGFVETSDADSEVLAANAVVWLAETHNAASNAPIRILGLTDAIATELTTRGVKFERLKGGPAKVAFDAVDVIIGSPQAFAKAGRIAELETWLRQGGGMLVAETAWGVLQLNKDLTIESLAANRLLAAHGIRFDSSANSGFGKDKDYPVEAELLPLANTDAALAALEHPEPATVEKTKDRTRELEFAAKVVGRAFEIMPLDGPFIARAKELEHAHRQELDKVYEGLSTKRLTAKANPLARAMIDLDSRLAMELAVAEIKAHPSSVAFPGAVGPAREADASVEIDASIPGWHTTGLYAPPGEVVTVKVSAELASTHVFVQIGAWRDPEDLAYRVRLRDALRRFEIDGAETQAASAIGGPIYIDLPREFAASHQGKVTVHILGAARAPRYTLGVTDLTEWQDTIRTYDAPWAEMESKNLVLTVPSSAIRDVDRPDLVMQHWDRVHEAMQSLEPRTPNHWADRPYRYVADASVSWGYMYCPSDGPIVIPSSAAADMFKLENFDGEGDNKLWGHYHEMGHSHQNPLWTDGATGEVTVNIFTVYALHTVNGYPLDSDAVRTNPKAAWEAFEQQRTSGKTFDEAGGPFEKLQYYALLWHAFGFDAFRETFERIRDLPEAQRPKGDDEERNVFVATFSEVCGHDLSDYAKAWGISVSEQTREKLKGLPAWMPEGSAAK